MIPDLRRAIAELDHCLALLDAGPQDANAFYLEPSLAVIDYCRTIVRLAKQEDDAIIRVKEVA